MIYQLDEILAALAEDPVGAIAGWEEQYRQNIHRVAEFIIGNRRKSPVVLLAGPSGSSKTSTATRIRDDLVSMGTPAHLLSMDNYFIDRDSVNYPRLPDGSQDLESPECLDMALLNEHFTTLERGEDVYVPEYDFHTKKRVNDRGAYLDAEKGDVFIFEGIHALNERFTAPHPNAARIYVSPEANYELHGQVICTPVLLRLMRRIVRDRRFRGASAEYSLALWGNVITSEGRHVLPYKAGANQVLVTALPYELGIFKNFIPELIADLPRSVPCREQVDAIAALLEPIPALDPDLVPDDSIIREFIGDRSMS